MDKFDLCCIVKAHLDRRGIQQQCFKNNMPGRDWVHFFLIQNKHLLACRMCQNIKRSRATISPKVVNDFFDNLRDTLKDVPPGNIMNYDETNLCDNPGRKKVIAKRGLKHQEHVMNSTKSTTSIVYAGCVDGSLLLPYVVYKATNM